MDFSQMPFLHPDPGGARFAGGFRLSGYTLSANDLEAGDTLDIDTVWSAGAPSLHISPAPVLELALVSPAEVLFHVPAVISEIRFGLEEDTTLRLRVPDDVTAGIYLPRLRIVNNGEKLAERTQNDAKIDVYYLQPIRIRPRIVPPEQPVGRIADVASLGAFDLRQISPERVEVSLTWWARQPIPANYVTSVRLWNEMGELVAQKDAQPCYGFCPTSLWEPRVPVHDRRWLDLPAGTPPGSNYQLEILLYEPASLASLGSVRLNNITLDQIAVKRDVRAPRSLFPTV